MSNVNDGRPSAAYLAYERTGAEHRDAAQNGATPRTMERLREARDRAAHALVDEAKQRKPVPRIREI